MEAGVLGTVTDIVGTAVVGLRVKGVGVGSPGKTVGPKVGTSVGRGVGSSVGSGDVGSSVLKEVGAKVGLRDGAWVTSQ